MTLAGFEAIMRSGVPSASKEARERGDGECVAWNRSREGR